MTALYGSTFMLIVLPFSSTAVLPLFARILLHLSGHHRTYYYYLAAQSSFLLRRQSLYALICFTIIRMTTISILTIYTSFDYMTGFTSMTLDL
jgi:hypothetical protein